MNKGEISDRIKRMLVDDLFLAGSTDEVADEADLGSDLGLDSVGFVELATIVGEVFQIKVTEADIGQGVCRTVQRLSDFVLSKLATRTEGNVDAGLKTA